MAAELVNLGPNATPAELDNLLIRIDYRPRRTPNARQTRALLEWAGRLRPVFGETDLDRQVDLVNALLADSAARPYISRHDGRKPHLHYADERRPVDERVFGYTSAGLATAVCQDGRRLGSCARAGCRIVYVDTSRNGRRRYCTTRCANRVHVADHRSRTSVPPQATEAAD
ncbi:putative DUF1470 family protein/CGNR zinc finger [Actinoalloteichus hymeniacidonis]|uniref:DUF1470 family protein/CGNR zinc finger n=2 Tax=Actinoalloteichus hymeniacidonis TaxID=340345 RepID=A0AAC9HQB4_9PSEU|nr:putative DUF1470 family protein/CGNR zinc finger [Actinoalloteichus hymeniacidonis]